jgi:hypothetical protein
MLPDRRTHSPMHTSLLPAGGLPGIMVSQYCVLNDDDSSDRRAALAANDIMVCRQCGD